MSHKLVSLYIEDGEYYTRTDADAVISELEKEIDKLQDKVTDLLLRDRNMALHFNNAVDDLVHNKYKRCLAMAKWCDDAARLATWDKDYQRCGWYNKWIGVGWNLQRNSRRRSDALQRLPNQGNRVLPQGKPDGKEIHPRGKERVA